MTVTEASDLFERYLDSGDVYGLIAELREKSNDGASLTVAAIWDDVTDRGFGIDSGDHTVLVEMVQTWYSLALSAGAKAKAAS